MDYTTRSRTENPARRTEATACSKRLRVIIEDRKQLVTAYKEAQGTYAVWVSKNKVN